MISTKKQRTSPREQFKAQAKSQFSPHRIKTIREAVGVFKDFSSLQATIEDLKNNGFMLHELSLLAGESSIKDKRGHLYRSIKNAEDDPRAPRTIFVATKIIEIIKGIAVAIPLVIFAVIAAGIVINSGGSIFDAVLYAFTAGAIGAGVGFMLSMFIARQRALYLQGQIKRGGIILWVQLRSPAMEKLARKILLKNGASDVHLHDISTDII